MGRVILFLTAIILGVGLGVFINKPATKKVLSSQTESSHWFILHRQSNSEALYQGIPGDLLQSRLIKTFRVKTGVPGKRPTPLPQLAGRKYWKIIEKHPEAENPETAPYFLTLDVPAPTDIPFGPVPYLECDGSASASPDGQCNWERFGDFGLHGINGDLPRLSIDDPGSSGCIRHTDEDITYLYTTLEPTKEEIRYYIEDN